MRLRRIKKMLLKFRYLLIGFIFLLLTSACYTFKEEINQSISKSPSPTIIPVTDLPTSTTIHSSTPKPPLPATPSPSPSIQHLRIFKELWNVVNENYLYPDFNGADWIAIYKEYRNRVMSGLSDDEFYSSMDEMLLQLDDEHSIFLSPNEAVDETARFEGDNDYVGIGILLTPIPERDRAVILLTFPGSPADDAGLHPRDSILTVNGEPILDENGLLTNSLRGPTGTSVSLTIQTPGENPREVKITRRRITGSIPVPHKVITNSGDIRIGYILLITLSDKTIGEQVGEALKSMSLEDPLDGLIIDNRMNEGGADLVLLETLSYFVHGPVGHFVNREKERILYVLGKEIAGSQEIPLVVLIGSYTSSYGEVLAGILKDRERAYLIGEPTMGNVETLWSYSFEDGSRAWIAHDYFRPLNHPQHDWEKTGIRPDLTINVNWDEVNLVNDPVVQTGVDYLNFLIAQSERPSIFVADSNQTAPNFGQDTNNKIITLLNPLPRRERFYNLR